MRNSEFRTGVIFLLLRPQSFFTRLHVDILNNRYHVSLRRNTNVKKSNFENGQYTCTDNHVFFPGARIFVDLRVRTFEEKWFFAVAEATNVATTNVLFKRMSALSQATLSHPSAVSFYLHCAVELMRGRSPNDFFFLTIRRFRAISDHLPCTRDHILRVFALRDRPL